MADLEQSIGRTFLMNALITEDEKLVTAKLTARIADVDPAIKTVSSLGSVKTALRWFEESAEPDVIFADIQLGDGVSFTIFEKFQLSCPVIFTTADNEYAIQAFKVNGYRLVKKMATLTLDLFLKALNHQVAIDISRDKAPSFKKWLEK